MANEPPTDHRAKIRPLESLKADGTRYTHPDPILESIAYYQSVPESIRIAEADRMPSETQTYFIRTTDRSGRVFYERLFQNLSRGAIRVIHQTIRGLPELDAADLTARVGAHVMEMIVKPKPSRKCELLEVHFRRAVEGEALDALRVHLRSPLGGLRRDLAAEYDDDGDEMERPLEMLPGNGPGPEGFFLILRDRNRRHQLLRIACRAVPDRRHLKAAVLRWGYGWPVTSRDRDQPSLMRHFAVSEAQMHRWLDGAMKAMREALENEPEMIQARATTAERKKGGR
ncbi:MAG TPA: hypothetical protein VGK48_19065 [Terriglobia bacterium]|jgi:hypothetical protein